MNMIKTYLTALAMLFTASTYASDVHLEAHVHGVVEMSLVAEADVVEVHIQSPLMNLVGFEHQAHTQAEHAAIDAMSAQFSAVEDWLQFMPAGCRLTNHSVQSGDQDDHVDQHHGHDHGHHHDHDTVHSNTRHADLQANYQFHCEAKTLKAVEVRLAEIFPAIEVIHVNWIIHDRAGIAELHDGQQRVNLAP